MNLETRDTLIWIFCIAVILSMCVKISIESQEYNCNDCTVSLTNTMAGSEQGYFFGTFIIQDLFREFTDDGYCLIKWDATQGYYSE